MYNPSAGTFVPSSALPISAPAFVPSTSSSNPTPDPPPSLVSRNGGLFVPPSSSDLKQFDDEHESLPSTSSNLPTEGFDFALGSTTVPSFNPNNSDSMHQLQQIQHAHFQQQKTTMKTLQIPVDLYTHLRNSSLSELTSIPPDDPRHREIPPEFHSISHLDSAQNATLAHNTSGSFGYPSIVYKVVSKESGGVFALRRFDNVKASQKIAAAAMAAWGGGVGTPKDIDKHPSLVKLSRAFVANRALFFVHDFHPQAKTLSQLYIGNGSEDASNLPERVIWSYITQISTLVKSVHERGMAVRCIHMSKVLRCAGGRVRVNCVGVVDVLEFEARRSLPELQREDMVQLGRLILSLCTRSMVDQHTDNNTLGRCILHIQQHFSPDLHALALTLISKPLPIYEITSLMANHMIDELETSMTVSDCYEKELKKEHESGRGLRLLMKLGFVNERPEFGMDSQWSETGDRYVLKLFRDYVFHQVDENGRPMMDLGHVVSSLNKLDCHDSEKISLSSRDGQAIMVVSFANIAVCLENAYIELMSSEQHTDGGQGQHGGGQHHGGQNQHQHQYQNQHQHQQSQYYG